MNSFSVVLVPSFRDRFSSKRKISSRSVCSVVAFQLVCLLSLFGSAAFGQAPVGDNFNESTLNTSLWLVKAPAGETAQERGWGNMEAASRTVGVVLAGGEVAAHERAPAAGPVDCLSIR